MAIGFSWKRSMRSELTSVISPSGAVYDRAFSLGPTLRSQSADCDQTPGIVIKLRKLRPKRCYQAPSRKNLRFFSEACQVPVVSGVIPRDNLCMCRSVVGRPGPAKHPTRTDVPAKIEADRGRGPTLRNSQFLRCPQWSSLHKS
jgi:hypothetical protein